MYEKIADNMLAKLLDETIEHNGKSISIRDALFAKLIDKAFNGDIKSIQLLLDRAYGKASDKLEVTGKDGQTLGFDNASTLQEIDNRLAELIASSENTVSETQIKD